jgi:hypothetical protein
MKVKVGMKLLSHCGNVWHVMRPDTHNPDRVVVKTEKDHQFFVQKSLIHHHAKPLRFWHRAFWRSK